MPPRPGPAPPRPHAAPTRARNALFSLHDLPTPALLLDLDVLTSNLDRMAERCRRLGVRLRPHVKTHKCVEVGRRQRERGARGITVSTLEEARVFADAGFDDLTWAFPVVPGRVAEAAELAHRVRLGVLVDDPSALSLLETAGAPFRVWIKVDCGYGRAGVDPGGPELLRLAGALKASEGLRFAGLLTHSGQAYAAASPAALAAVAEEERSVMVAAADRLREAGLEVPAVSVGSTPAMSHAAGLDGVDEVRPGNYALHDGTQVALGACRVEDVAATVLATVVSSRPGREHCVLDAGALALSKDPGPSGDPRSGYGRLYRDLEGSELEPDLRLTSLSQEHGVVSGRLPHGRRVRILPNHACLAVACFDRFHVIREGRLVARWTIHRER